MKTAIILCDGDFATEDAKAANDLVRFSDYYKIIGIIDKNKAGLDAGLVLDNKKNGIPIFPSIESAFLKYSNKISHLIIGTLPVTAELSESIVQPLQFALMHGLTIINGLHTFLAEDPRFKNLIRKYKGRIIDIRKYQKKFRKFSGAIKNRHAYVISSVGIDANIGKMTSCLKITEALNKHGIITQFVATGQIGKMVGTEFFKPIDSIPGPYESGELESLILEADQSNPDIIIVEGQGCISYPPYGTLNFRHEVELMHESNVLEAALLEGAKPDALIITHAPKRKTLSGFPQYQTPLLFKEIKLNEMVAGAPVIAISINHEDMTKLEVDNYCKQLSLETCLPVEDALYSTSTIVNEIIKIVKNSKYKYGSN